MRSKAAPLAGPRSSPAVGPAHRYDQGRSAWSFTLGLQKEDPTIAEFSSARFATGQFGKNILGDRNEFLPTVHGFDEFYGNLYHLNPRKNPNCRLSKDPAFRASSDRAS